MKPSFGLQRTQLCDTVNLFTHSHHHPDHTTRGARATCCQRYGITLPAETLEIRSRVLILSLAKPNWNTEAILTTYKLFNIRIHLDRLYNTHRDCKGTNHNPRFGHNTGIQKKIGRLRLKCDGTRAETRFRLSAKRTSPFKSAGGVSSVNYWQSRCAHQR